MQSARSRPLVGRRALLGLGLAGGLSILSACSLRLDLPPEVPQPSAADATRSELASILGSTRSSDAQTELLAELRAAVGPEWAPPTELVTPTATPSPSSYDYEDGLAAAAELVLDRLGSLVAAKSEDFPGSGLAALVDVAIGCTLALSRVDAGRAAALGDRFAEPAGASAAPSTPAAGSGDGGPGAGGAVPDAEDGTGPDRADDPEDPALGTALVEDFVLTCYQAAYGYERLAVFHESDSPYGAFARDRVTELDQAATLGNELLSTHSAASVSNRPAWAIEPEPVDAASALETARALEDQVAAAVLGLFSALAAEYLAVDQLWRSARARAEAGQPQTLRYQIHDLAAESPTAGPGAES
ncbi:hypothetical protein GCM10022261_25090 [Brevibacterium daeguense]|uniref:DUF4439 domain-containing protein n=1 Tax=Brevibacterium daeguense TaxID=909936 RepID=A0ABP8EM18_9MICO|nr:hypothetical protein [Brevibacterium daeguense]